MTKLLDSILETYLLDEEADMVRMEQCTEKVVEQCEHYPEGFFSSL